MQLDAPLQHELRDHAVEGAALVAKASLAGAQRSEVLRRLGHVLAIQAEGDLARRLAACAFAAASAAQPRGRWVASGGVRPRTDLFEGRASAQDGRGAAQHTHRDVKEHLGAKQGNRKAQRTVRAAAAGASRRACRAALGRVSARRDRRPREHSAPSSSPWAPPRPWWPRKRCTAARASLTENDVACSSAFRGAIARRDDERRSVHNTAHACTHRRAGAAARRAAGSAALRRRELSCVALMTADDIGTDGDGSEQR